MTAPPIPMVHEGEGRFVALPRFHNVVAAHYGAGEIVLLAPVEERSKKSHDHFFVVMGEIFNSLPEGADERWATSDHFRKHGLIACGYHDERSIVCASRAEALRVAAFIRPMDEYALVDAREAVVTVYTAKSQSMRAMGREVFQRSKDAVLGWAAAQIGVEVSDIRSSQGASGAKHPARVAA